VPGEFPTLGYAVADLIQSICAIPDGERAGDPYLLTDEMLRFLLWFYRIDPDTTKDRGTGNWRLPFVYYRGAQLVRPQKWGKGPFSASITCAEAHPEGPVLFDGWDANGEPVGKPWPTPIIQVTAASEDQADNVWGALLPMIQLGALAADITDTGLTRINLPSGGKIEPVSSSALSRLGQRITGAVQDQTESWTRSNRLRGLADTQRRGLAGMGGRFLSTANAWNPAEDSVAQYTAEHEHDGVYHDDVDPGVGSVRNKAERRKMLKKVYGDSWWVDLDRVSVEIEALLHRDPAQAERWFLNRKRASEDAAFSPDHVDLLADTATRPEPGELITIGVDGARFRDALGIVATGVQSGRQWCLGVWERPPNAGPRYEHPDDEVDGVMIEAFETWDPWRVYVDPQYIKHLLERWQGRWGEKRVLPWLTNRPRQMAYAVRNYEDAFGAAVRRREAGNLEPDDLSLDGHPVFAQHLKNARRIPVNVMDDEGRPMHVLGKESQDSKLCVDCSPAAVLSWEARGDAIAAGAQTREPMAAWI